MMAMAMAMETPVQELMARETTMMLPSTPGPGTVAERNPLCKRDAVNALGTRGAPRTPAPAAHVYARVGSAATAWLDRTVATDRPPRPQAPPRELDGQTSHPLPLHRTHDRPETLRPDKLQAQPCEHRAALST